MQRRGSGCFPSEGHTNGAAVEDPTSIVVPDSVVAGTSVVVRDSVVNGTVVLVAASVVDGASVVVVEGYPDLNDMVCKNKL